MRPYQLLVIVTFICVPMLGLGCLFGSNSETVVPVSGVILLDQIPLAKGYITFVPKDPETTTTVVDVEDGEFSASVPTGIMRVEIRSPKVVGSKSVYDTPGSPMEDVFEESIPPKYNDRSVLEEAILLPRDDLKFQLSAKSS